LKSRRSNAERHSFAAYPSTVDLVPAYDFLNGCFPGGDSPEVNIRARVNEQVKTRMRNLIADGSDLLAEKIGRPRTVFNVNAHDTDS
jgi:hypothetical protein